MFIKYYSSNDAADAISPYHVGDVIKTDSEVTTESGIIEAGTPVTIVKIKPKAEYKSAFSNIPIGKENNYIAEPSTCKYAIKVNDSEILLVNGEDIFDWESPKRTKLYDKCNKRLNALCIGFYGLFFALIALIATYGILNDYKIVNDPYTTTYDPHCAVGIALGILGLFVYVIIIFVHHFNGGVDYAKFSIDDQCAFYTKDTENSLSAFRAFWHLD